VARSHPEFDHALGPDLFDLLKNVDQFAQVMRSAQPVQAEQITVRFPALVDERAQKAGKPPPRVEGPLSPFRVTGDPSEIRSRPLLERVPGMSLLSAVQVFPCLTQRLVALGLESPSEDGGLLEWRLFCARRASSSITFV
jgi:hypothetical protein